MFHSFIDVRIEDGFFFSKDNGHIKHEAKIPVSLTFVPNIGFFYLLFFRIISSIRFV